MPTGYTDAIKDDITFTQYAMNCARAFGACIELRDESGGGEKIPEQFQPSDYHVKAREQQEVLMAEIEAMTAEQCVEAAEKDFQGLVDSSNQAIADRKALRIKYEAMLAQVNAWTPPSQEHIGLQNFMRKQIEDSIPFDCDTSYYERNLPQRISPDKWRTEQISNIRQRIAYHEKGYAEEVARTNSRNEWIRLLRESMAPVETRAAQVEQAYGRVTMLP